MSDGAKLLHNAASGRVLLVKIGNTKFTTPTRALQHTELKKYADAVAEVGKGKISQIEPLPHKIQEVVLDLRPESLGRLSTDNNFFSYQKSRIKSLSKSNNGRIRICYPRLVSQEDSISDEAIRMLSQVQISANSLDFISVPDSNLYSSETKHFEKQLQLTQEIMDEYSIKSMQLMPFLDLKSDPLDLGERLRFIIDSGFTSVGIRFRRGHEPSARQVGKILGSEDIWIHLAGVPKKLSGMPVIPQIHLMPFFSFDSISSFKGYGRPPQKRSENLRMQTVPERRDPDSSDNGVVQIRAGPTSPKLDPRFDSNNLGFLSKNEHLKRLGNQLHCNCFLCRGQDIESFYEKYGMTEKKYSPYKLKKYLSVHEMLASHQEFHKSQISINESDYRSYLRKKPIIMEYGTQIREIDFKTLDEYF